MPSTLEFYFDFGSPNAYIAHVRLPAILARTRARVEYKIMLLGGVFQATGNVSPAAVKFKIGYTRRDMLRFIGKYQVPFRMNPHFPVNTVQVMRGALVAEPDGRLMPYIDAVFHHMWEEPKKMDDPEVIRAALDASGLDGARILARIQDQDVKDKLIKNTEGSVARGTFGAPTFFVGEEIFFGKDKLRDVEEEIEAQKARSA
jgi:2-hydroxychromene-2-carboxylate isomerase